MGKAPNLNYLREQWKFLMSLQVIDCLQFKIIHMPASCQDGSIGRHGSPLSTTTSKLQLKYRTTISQKQVEWKSDNYRSKETTTIQTGRRGTDMEYVDPLIYVWWINIREGYLGNEESQPHTKPPSPEFQCQEDKSLQFLATKTSRDWTSGRNFWSPK